MADPNVKDKLDYYKARIAYIEQLLDGQLSPKQRREAEVELDSVSVKLLRSQPQKRE